MKIYFLKLKRISKYSTLILLVLCSYQLPSNAQEPIMAIDRSLSINSKVSALGELLFNDPKLSKSDTLSCSTCHPVARATADGISFSLDINGKPLEINTPSLNYVVLNHYFTWTGSLSNLATHLTTLIQKPNLFNQSWPGLIKKLMHNGYVPKFKQAGLGSISQISITAALVEYQRSLVTPSRFDLFLTGDKNKLSSEEILGYKLFKDYGCISCHQGINIGGNMRQKLGIMKDYFRKGDDIKTRDLGYFNTTKDEEDKFNFRVPSLRNVSLTAPYFHDGSVETLQEAIEIMLEYQLGVTIPLNDIKLIEAFLGSLEGLDE